MKRSQPRLSAALVLLVLTLVSFACKKTPAPPPPPPPATATTGITPVTPAIPAPTVTLRADTQTITRGGTVTITYESRNAATVDIQPGIGSVTPVATGTRQVTPASSVTYTAIATGPGGMGQDVLRITVNDPPPPPPTPQRGGPPVVISTPVLTSQQLFDQNMQAINFDYDKSDIREDQKPKLMAATNYMKANPSVRVTVEGNTDERGSEEYNLALGDRRANAVKQYLVAQGIPENRLSSVSYGEERPGCNTQTEDCFAQNRRAAFKLNP